MKTRHNDMNQKTSIIQYNFNEDVNKRLSKLSKDVSIHATLKKNEVSIHDH